jgi:hypothetical protein
MSTESTTSDSPALGARTNFWGDDDGDDLDGGGHSECVGTDAAEHKARELALRFCQPLCRTQLEEPAWNGGRRAEQFAWLLDGECIDGRGDVLHREQRAQELSEPKVVLPRQVDVGSRIIEYGAYRCRRRVNPETGYLNWGETTGTAIPEFDEDIYQLCVHTYLAERDCRLTGIEQYLEYAERVWTDPQYSSTDALEQFIRKVREWEDE